MPVELWNYGKLYESGSILISFFRPSSILKLMIYLLCVWIWLLVSSWIFSKMKFWSLVWFAGISKCAKVIALFGLSFVIWYWVLEFVERSGLHLPISLFVDLMVSSPCKYSFLVFVPFRLLVCLVAENELEPAHGSSLHLHRLSL